MENVQIIEVAYAAGTSMPRHIATGDAYLVAEEGSAILIYANESYEVNQGGFALIPANEEHLLKIITDFKGFIVLPLGALIKFADTKNKLSYYDTLPH